jgi:alkylhydroperoxidase/carboxymuconolactone decarboxylase family protein YurZ
MVSLYDHNPRSNCTSAEKGLEIQRQILGDCIEQMYAQSPKDQLHIQQYLSANCFGDYLTRKGLDLKTRELLTLSMLAALGGCEPQLAEHVAANLAVGNDRQVLITTSCLAPLPKIGARIFHNQAEAVQVIVMY